MSYTVVNRVFGAEGYQLQIVRGRQPIIWPNCPENCMKVKKIGPVEGAPSKI